MIKTLIKKQLAELFSTMFGRSAMGKNGKKKGMVALYIVLLLYVFGVFGYMFYGTADMLFEAFVPMNLAWLGFALMGIAATGFGVLGTVFMTNSVLYGAKDNELLLAMPIKPAHIIFSRIFTLYVMDVIYEAMILLPCFAAYIVRGNAYFGVIFAALAILAVLPLLSLALSLVLGFLVALFSGRIKNKSLVTMVVSVAFIVVYFYVAMQMQSYITMLVANGAAIAENIQAFVYPVYSLGLAGTGDLLHLLFFTLCVAAVFAVVCLIVCKSFIKLATMKKGGKRTLYRERAHKSRGAFGALLKKELAHFWASPAYLMNAGMGAIMMLLGAVLLIVKGGELAAMPAIPEMAAFEKMVPLIAAAAISMVSSTSFITAPSVSLEGKNVWLLRSLPVLPLRVLQSKLALHMLVSGVSALVLSVVCVVVLPMDVFCAVLLPILALVLNFLFAVIGLALNLKFPNFDWTNEVVPVKQGMSVGLAMLAGMGVTAFFAIVYLVLTMALSLHVPAALFLLAVLIICGAVSALIYAWICKRGTKIFETF